MAPKKQSSELDMNIFPTARKWIEYHGHTACFGKIEPDNK